jgi:hypothetical protein
MVAYLQLVYCSLFPGLVTEGGPNDEGLGLIGVGLGCRVKVVAIGVGAQPISS